MKTNVVYIFLVPLMFLTLSCSDTDTGYFLPPFSGPSGSGRGVRKNPTEKLNFPLAVGNWWQFVEYGGAAGGVRWGRFDTLRIVGTHTDSAGVWWDAVLSIGANTYYDLGSVTEMWRAEGDSIFGGVNLADAGTGKGKTAPVRPPVVFDRTSANLPTIDYIPIPLGNTVAFPSQYGTKYAARTVGTVSTPFGNFDNCGIFYYAIDTMPDFLSGNYGNLVFTSEVIAPGVGPVEFSYRWFSTYGEAQLNSYRLNN